ncbi:MAG: hypothetical protein ABSF50_23220, partial [Burkholderiaceae bacterium]
QHRRLRRAALRPNELNRLFSGREFGTGHHGAQGIEDAMSSVLQNRLRQDTLASAGHIGCQLAGGVARPTRVTSGQQ